jgi:hypothetical protein
VMSSLAQWPEKATFVSSSGLWTDDRRNPLKKITTLAPIFLYRLISVVCCASLSCPLALSLVVLLSPKRALFLSEIRAHIYIGTKAPGT